MSSAPPASSGGTRLRERASTPPQLLLLVHLASLAVGAEASGPARGEGSRSGRDYARIGTNGVVSRRPLHGLSVVVSSGRQISNPGYC
jgi:hypothetical protein